MEADLTLARTSRLKDDAEKWASSMEEEIQYRLDDASRKRSTARDFAEKIESTARSAADALMNQTRAGAEELANRMRSESSEDIRKILSDIEVARSAAEDELEAQRLLTETARVRAFTVGLNMQDAREDASATAKPAPTAKKTVAKAKSKASAVKPTPISSAKPGSARKVARKATRKAA